jgi:hypothetical protein
MDSCNGAVSGRLGHVMLGIGAVPVVSHFQFMHWMLPSYSGSPPSVSQLQLAKRASQ